MKRTIIGIDLAKNVFEVYVEDGSGAVVERKRLSRKKLLPWLANQAPALVGMEACGGAHYWARELTKLGHDVRVIAPQYVKPWVQTNKSDAADARAVCRAVQEPGMRFVGMASEAQQAVQAPHRVRSRHMGNRTALVNQIRGILLEYGVAIPQGVASVRKMLPLLLAEERWGPLLQQFLIDQQAELRYWDAKIEAGDGADQTGECHAAGLSPPRASSGHWPLRRVGSLEQNGRPVLSERPPFRRSLGAGPQAHRHGGEGPARRDQ